MANIFILDDDLAFLKQLKGLLDTLGHSPKLSMEQENFFKRLESEFCDLILMDIHMPGINGIELLQQIKSHPLYQKIPVIMLTIDPDERILEQCFESGAADFINKPVSKMVLKNRINAVLKIKEYQDRLMEKNNELEEAMKTQQRSQRRLAKILDIAEEAIITIDETKQINFFNQRAEQIFGYSTQEMLGQSIDLLISPESIDTTKLYTTDIADSEHSLTQSREVTQIVIQPKNQEPCLMKTSIFNLKLGDETLLALILREAALSLPDQYPEKSFRISSKTEFTEELRLERQRIQVLGEAFDGAIKMLSHGGHRLIRELRNVDCVLNGMNEYLSEESQNEDFLKMLVHVLTLSLEYWEIATGKTKIELAEESGIWKASIDKDVLRTRTLDRYLSLKTLPNKPRWKEVLETARYVMNHCPSIQPLQSELKAKVSELQDILRTKRS